MITELLILAAILWAIFARGQSPRLGFCGGLQKHSTDEKLGMIVRFMREQNLTLEQVAQAWAIPAPVNEDSKGKSRDIIVKVMLFMGAVFILAGVSVYIHSFWDSMSSLLRIVMTLGVGFALSLFSIAMMRQDKSEKAVLPFIILAAIFEVGGWGVFLHEMFPHSDDLRKAALFCFGIMALKQAAVFHVFRHDALLFTATAFLYAALDAALDLAGMRQDYIAIVLGGSMFFTAHVISKTPHAILSACFYLIAASWFSCGVFVALDDVVQTSTAAIITGASLFMLAHTVKNEGYPGLSILGYAIAACVFYSGMYLAIEQAYHASMAGIVTGFSLCCMGYGLHREVEQNTLSAPCLLIGSALFYCGLFDEVHHTKLELLYFAITIYAMYASALLHSRALLFTSVLAILGFIGYYTNEYFLNSAGWPIALMVMGVAFLGVGSVAINIKRKYNM